MDKPIEQIQKENRKFILEAIHGCSYEEALKKELSFGCSVIDKKHQFFGELAPEEMTLVYGNGVDDEEADHFYFLHYRGNPCVSFSKQDIFDKDRFEIIGKPLTLDRVLLGLSLKDTAQVQPEPKFYNRFLITLNGYAWDLTLSTLEKQSEETQRAINKILIAAYKKPKTIEEIVAEIEKHTSFTRSIYFSDFEELEEVESTRDANINADCVYFDEIVKHTPTGKFYRFYTEVSGEFYGKPEFMGEVILQQITTTQWVKNSY